MKCIVTIAAIVVGVLLMSGGCAIAEPNGAEVIAYRALVPDYSRTSGGYSPALSPDGKTLAYMTSEGEIWVIHGIDLYSDRMPTPWKLDSRPEENGQLGPNIFDLRHARNLDWSHDGKSLAFGYIDGRLYIADNFDYDLRIARVRTVVTSREIDGDRNCSRALGMPRWSPDDRRIAFVREMKGSTASVSVLNVQTGKAAVIAGDAIRNASVWAQPWSSDGRFLYYGSKDKESGKHSVAIITSDGRQVRRIASDYLPCPSWDPEASRLAFKSQKETTLKLSANLGLAAFSSTISIAEHEGSDVTSVTRPAVPTSGQTSAAIEECRKQLRERILTSSGSLLARDQKSRLDQGRMDIQEMSSLVCLFCARSTGGMIRQLAEKLIQNGTAKSDALTEMLVASKDIPSSEKQRFLEKVSEFLSGIAPADWYGRFEFDSNPVWSPDGRRIAFTRANHKLNRERLCVVDLDTRKERELFISGEIRGVMWSRDGKLLVLQSRRLMALRPEDSAGTGDSISSQLGPRSISTPGYPEIWLLQVEPNQARTARAPQAQPPQKKPTEDQAAAPRPEILRSIYVCPGHVGLLPNGKHQFQVFGLDEDGNEVSVPSKVIWATDARAGEITKDGMFTAGNASGVFPGAVRITAGKFTATAIVEVLKDEPRGRYVLEKVIGGVVPGVLSLPEGVAVDKRGFIYVADSGSQRVHIFRPDGRPAGCLGDSFGTGEGQLAYPQSVAVDSSGNVYIAGSICFSKYDSSNRFVLRWDLPRVEPGTEGAGMSHPRLTVDREGNVYTVNGWHNRVEKYDPLGKLLATWGSYGSGNGQFKGPSGIAVDSGGCVYVSDWQNHRVQKFDASGNYLTQWGAFGSGGGQLGAPTGIAVDANNTVYVADRANKFIQVFDAEGNFLTQFGNQGGRRQLDRPEGVAVDASGNVLVADSNNCRIVKFNANGEYVGQFGEAGVSNGHLRDPRTIAFGRDKSVHVGDFWRHTIQRFSADGSYLGKVDLADLYLSNWNFALDSAGNSYVVCGNFIHKIDADGAVVAKFGLTEDGKHLPTSCIALDASENILVAGAGVLLKLDPAGKVVFRTGSNGDGDGDGQLGHYSTAVAADGRGHIYVVDLYKHSRLQEFDPDGKFVNKWQPGKGILQGADVISSVSSDADGNVLVLARGPGHHRIIKLETGEVLAELPSHGSAVSGIMAAPDGRIYAAESHNNCVCVYVPRMGNVASDQID